MSNSKKPKNLKSYLISTDDANKMRRSYLKNQYKTLCKEQDFKDTLSVWYPIEIIEEYIEYLKGLKSITGESVSGIRFYFGAYPKGKEGPKVTKDYKRRQTVILLPTREKDLSKIKSNKKKKLAKKCIVLQHETVFIKHGSKKFTVLKENSNLSKVKNMNTALNVGHGMPPPPWN